eukprot:5331000-Lingulodinium_polyedra.AAC.1
MPVSTFVGWACNLYHARAPAGQQRSQPFAQALLPWVARAQQVNVAVAGDDECGSRSDVVLE